MSTGDETTKAEYKARDEPDVTQIRSYWSSRKRCVQWLGVQKRNAAQMEPDVIDLTDQPGPDQPKAKRARQDDASSQIPKGNNVAPEPESRSEESQPVPYNPREGDEMAKQLGESLDDFFGRLPPSTTDRTPQQKYIYIEYPLAKRSPVGDIPDFKLEGRLLLDGYLSQRRRVEEKNPEKATGTITRMMKPARVALEEDILKLARAKSILRGKWMLFIDHDGIDSVWQKVAEAVTAGELGIGAKVGTAEGNCGSRLVSIFNRDFDDKEEIKRVVSKLKQMRLVNIPIYYKSDAFTYLDIKSGNPYGLKAAMYCSGDLL